MESKPNKKSGQIKEPEKLYERLCVQFAKVISTREEPNLPDVADPGRLYPYGYGVPWGRLRRTRYGKVNST